MTCAGLISITIRLPAQCIFLSQHSFISLVRNQDYCKTAANGRSTISNYNSKVIMYKNKKKLMQEVQPSTIYESIVPTYYLHPVISTVLAMAMATRERARRGGCSDVRYNKQVAAYRRRLIGVICRADTPRAAAAAAGHAALHCSPVPCTAQIVYLLNGHFLNAAHSQIVAKCSFTIGIDKRRREI